MKQTDKKVTRWFKGVETYGGGFLKSFTNCWNRADYNNREILFPVLEILMQKYPQYQLDVMQPKNLGESVEPNDINLE